MGNQPWSQFQNGIRERSIQFNSISIGKKVGGIGLSMDTGPALYFSQHVKLQAESPVNLLLDDPFFSETNLIKFG